MPRAILMSSSSGLGVLLGHHVVFAGVVTRAFVAGSGVLAVSELFLELFPLFPHVLDVLAGVAVCLDDLFEWDAGVDLGGMLVRPVGFEGRVVPVVEWSFEVGDGTDDAVDNHQAGGDAVARPDGGVFWVGFVYVGEYFG